MKCFQHFSLATSKHHVPVLKSALRIPLMFYCSLPLKQCRRTEIYPSLPDEAKILVDTMDHLGLREWIRNCIFSSKHEQAQKEALEPFLPKPWTDFWIDMTKNGVWVENAIVECTAWFLEIDFMVISEDNDESRCVTMLYGNIDGIQDPARPTLHLGFARNHYQSILPAENCKDNNIFYIISLLTFFIVCWIVLSPNLDVFDLVQKYLPNACL